MKRNVVVMLVCLSLLIVACVPTEEPSPPPEKRLTKSKASSFATGGEKVFGNICARCHGTKGQGLIGPAIIGSNANLEKFNTAQGLYDFISVAMPFNAPGSLSRQEYLQAMSFLLVENGFIEPDTMIDPDDLKSIVLQKGVKLLSPTITKPSESLSLLINTPSFQEMARAKYGTRWHQYTHSR